MVMRSEPRVLTVEEALALPRPSASELTERERGFDEFRRISAELQARIRDRLGRDLRWEEIEDALGRDDESEWLTDRSADALPDA